MYFECDIKSNPAVQEVGWLFQGQPLFSDQSHGIIVANHSLVLQRVQRTHRGRYACLARNELGESESETFDLKVLCK